MSKNVAEGKTKECVPLTKINLELLKFNQEIYDRCGKFEIRLIHSCTGEEVSPEPQFKYAGKVFKSAQVSGVLFHLLDEEDIRRVAANQAKIRILTPKLKRRKAFSDWDYGAMHPIGSRQGSGGRAGDGYTCYPATVVITQEDVHTLFSYVSVCLFHTHVHG